MTIGEVRNFSRWKNSLLHLDSGRYANDTVVDYLQNKDTKALIFTDKHLVYINLKRHRLRWAFPVADLTSITTHGLRPAQCVTTPFSQLALSHSACTMPSLIKHIMHVYTAQASSDPDLYICSGLYGLSCICA